MAERPEDRRLAREAARGVYHGSSWIARHIQAMMVRRVGGAARARVIWMFGLVLALNGADLATIGAISPQLQSGLHISTTQIGLLSSVSLLVGAIATIPVGLMVDRVKRIPLLSVSIVLWSVASMLSAFAGSYSTLLLTRVLLGAVVATAGPAIASLTGDYFPAQERGRIYAYILGGEIGGNALGFIVSGMFASAFGWRAPFFVLAIPGFFLARALIRTVPEPLRGGQSHLEDGVDDLVEAAATARAREQEGWFDSDLGPGVPRQDDIAAAAARKLGFKPDPELVLEEDPRTLSLIDSIRYVLKIPTNVYMVISSSLGYFYFTGLTTFALLFVRGHYHINQAESELVLAVLVGGALVGTLVSGWLADELVKRGHLNARVWFPAISYLLAAVMLVPGMLGTSLTPALWFDTAGAALISAANPPLDAARLDIMPAGLWGRAESVRTFIRSLAQAAAPLVFGGLADLIAGFYPKQAPVGTHPSSKDITAPTTHGLEITFLILLVALALGGVAMLRARHTYPRDVATAAASNQGSVEPSIPAFETRAHRQERTEQNERESFEPHRAPQTRVTRRRRTAGKYNQVPDADDPPEWPGPSGAPPRNGDQQPPRLDLGPSEDAPPRRRRER
jgi:MFS family permease